MKFSGTTRVLAVFGDPIAHSLSPLMQNRALELAKINAVYVPYHVPSANLRAAVEAVRVLDIWGVNLTVPLKEAVCPLLDELDEDARLVGAVNTIVNRRGRLVGYNTDVHGVRQSIDLDLQFDPAGQRVLLLGAGGACRAAVVALCRAGVKWIGIANRTFNRARALESEFAKVFTATEFASFRLDPGSLMPVVKELDLLVNTSAVGLKGESFVDFPWPRLAPGIPVLDVVYSPGETAFVTAAREHGHPAVEGLGMLAAQGEKAFQLWTGATPPEGVMRNCLLARQQGIMAA